MPIVAGTRIGSYEVTTLLGKGGMGEVYRATDLKLKREVAVKVLPAAWGENRERMQRFLREAEVLASLNHPNIAQIYGLEESGDTRAIVMELVEGETLADIIKRGPIPIDTAIDYAKQILSAFEYAHDRPKAVIHRDLKPANVKVTPEGVVKVLDFGLAKALAEERTESADPEMSPTLTLGPTVVGVILGTASYMSPEQAKGKNADRRSDIWSFGAMLYEMCSGKRPFVGEDVADILAAVLTKDPDLSLLPARVRPTVERCLRKDPRKRWYSMEDIRFALDEQPEASGVAAVPQGPTVASRLSWVLAAAFAVVAVAVSAIHFREKPEDKPLVRLDVDLGEDVSLPPPPNGPPNIALSPDGTKLAYTSGNPVSLFLRRLDQAKATELPGTKGAAAPFFSPDGQWIGFYANGKLNKISIDGGAAIPIVSTVTALGAVWAEDDSIVASIALYKGLVRVPSTGGTPTTIEEAASGDLVHFVPQLLPGGKAVLFANFFGSSADNDNANIEVVSLQSHQRKVLARGATSPRYLPSGHLIYTTKSTLFAVPFDPDKLELKGNPVPVLDDVGTNGTGRVAYYSISNTGTLVYSKANGKASHPQVYQWVDATGKREPLLAKPGGYTGDVQFSPDGKRLAVIVNGGAGTDLWVYDTVRDAMTRLTSLGTTGSPVWSPDGHYIAFRTNFAMYYIRADGSSPPQIMLANDALARPTSFSPDGKHLAYYTASAPEQLWVLPIEEQAGQLKAGTPEQFLKGTFNAGSPTFSPDGHWIAYLSDESGRVESYVRPYPAPASGQGGKWQVSNNGSNAPHWSRDGKEIIYREGDRLMAVSYTVKGDAFLADKPRVVIPKLGAQNWAGLFDGRRAAVRFPVGEEAAPQREHTIVMLQNFFDELRRKVPVAK